MNRDIVTNMVNEMGLTPARVDYLQNQQGQPLNMPSQHEMQPPQDYPESELEMMEKSAAYEPAPMAYQERRPQQQFMEEEEEQVEEQDEREEVKQETTFDKLLRYLKTPVIVALIFALFNLSYTNNMIQQFLPAVILGSGTYLLAFKSLLVAMSFSMVHYLIE